MSLKWSQVAIIIAIVGLLTGAVWAVSDRLEKKVSRDPSMKTLKPKTASLFAEAIKPTEWGGGRKWAAEIVRQDGVIYANDHHEDSTGHDQGHFDDDHPASVAKCIADGE